MNQVRVQANLGANVGGITNGTQEFTGPDSAGGAGGPKPALPLGAAWAMTQKTRPEGRVPAREDQTWLGETRLGHVTESGFVCKTEASKLGRHE